MSLKHQVLVGDFCFDTDKKDMNELCLWNLQHRILLLEISFAIVFFKIISSTVRNSIHRN